MKKFVAILLTLVLSLMVVIPVNAEGEVYMIYDCETDDGRMYVDMYCSMVGPVIEGGALANNTTPAPTQGNSSFAVLGYDNILFMTQYIANIAGTFDATGFEYVEFDIYSSKELAFNLFLNFFSSDDDINGSSYGIPNAYLPADEWVHVKMPLSQFSEFSEEYGGSFDNINKIRVSLYNVIDPYKVKDSGVEDAPNNYCVYFDNFTATNGDMAGMNELEEFDINTWETNDSETDEPEHIVKVGDVNEDDEIVVQDALLVLQQCVGKVSLNDYQYENADVDGDGEVTLNDALQILQYLTGKITEFPVNAIPLPDTLMLYACEDSEGTTDNSFNPLEAIRGPVEANTSFGHPAPVQGSYSYCVNTSSDSISLSHNMVDSVDLSEYDYIELDVYSNWEIVLNWKYGLCANGDSDVQYTWEMQYAFIPEDRWTHVKMPVSAFTNSDGTMNNISGLTIEITNILESESLMYGGDFVTPVYTYIYFDNIVATKNGAGKDNEFVNFETIMTTPPDWYEEYWNGRVTCNGGLYLP